MKRTTALTWSHLSVLDSKRAATLRDAYGDLDTVLQKLDARVLRGLGCRGDTVAATLKRLHSFDAAACERNLEASGIRFLALEDDDYPDPLRHIPDPPLFLYSKGSLKILDAPCIALVGTRRMSTYGKRVTEEFVAPLVAAGCTTVSGLALGVDALVAKETLRARGKTVAVLGHGFQHLQFHPNAALADRILDEGGLLLTEYAPDIPPGKFTFPGRNRIIAGLCQATIILEAPDTSGALYTANFALEDGREVFAVPGQIFDTNYVGCHALIAESAAHLVTHPYEVLQELRLPVPGKDASPVFVAKSNDEQSLYSALTVMPQTVTALVEQSALPTGVTQTLLTMLELRGIAKNIGQGEWVRL